MKFGEIRDNLSKTNIISINIDDALSEINYATIESVPNSFNDMEVKLIEYANDIWFCNYKFNGLRISVIKGN